MFPVTLMLWGADAVSGQDYPHQPIRMDNLLIQASSGVVAIPSLKPAFEKALGREIALSTLYRVLARHGWRKRVPDPVHQGDPSRRGAFK